MEISSFFCVNSVNCSEAVHTMADTLELEKRFQADVLCLLASLVSSEPVQLEIQLDSNPPSTSSSLSLSAQCTGQEGRILLHIAILRFNNKTKVCFSPTCFSSSEKVKLADCRWAHYLLCFSQLERIFFFSAKAAVWQLGKQVFVLHVCVCLTLSKIIHIVQDCWYLCVLGLDLALCCDSLPNKTQSEDNLRIGLDFRRCQLGARQWSRKPIGCLEVGGKENVESIVTFCT